MSYLLQEIYGIENKYNTQDSKVRTAAADVESVDMGHSAGALFGVVNESEIRKKFCYGRSS